MAPSSSSSSAAAAAARCPVFIRSRNPSQVFSFPCLNETQIRFSRFLPKKNLSRFFMQEKNVGGGCWSLSKDDLIMIMMS